MDLPRIGEPCGNHLCKNSLDKSNYIEGYCTEECKEESKKTFWKGVYEASQQVATWPCWKQNKRPCGDKVCEEEGCQVEAVSGYFKAFKVRKRLYGPSCK